MIKVDTGEIKMEKSFMDYYFSKNKVSKCIIDIGEWVILLAIGTLFKRPRLKPRNIYRILGALFIIFGIILHKLSHIAHPEAHKPTGEITHIITNGIYARMRHPGYSAYIFAYVGLFLIIRSYSMIIPILIFILILIDTANKEEKLLIAKFGELYEKYKEQVPRRFIPKFIN